MSDLPEPLAVWDARAEGLSWEDWVEASRWAMAHIPWAEDCYRAEFYLVDTPFARLYRYKRNEQGCVYAGPDGKIATCDPVDQALAELPPQRLLRNLGAR